MLPRHHRLRHRNDFNTVYQRSRRVQGSFLSLRVHDRRDSRWAVSQSDATIAATRIGISISRKVSKRAVVRNRIKRQIRAVWRQLLPHISPGFDVITIVHPSASECNWSQFLSELKQLVTKAEVGYGDS